MDLDNIWGRGRTCANDRPKDEQDRLGPGHIAFLTPLPLPLPLPPRAQTGNSTHSWPADLQHHWWKLLLGNRLYMAPIGQPADALDIGTGTGIWAIQFAQQHPRASVIGTDLSLIQPRDGIPPNCTFEREDSEEQWVFDKQFDYIHWRLMLTCFHDFEGMIARVFEHLKPGGCESGFPSLPSPVCLLVVLGCADAGGESHQGPSSTRASSSWSRLTTPPRRSWAGPRCCGRLSTRSTPAAGWGGTSTPPSCSRGG